MSKQKIDECVRQSLRAYFKDLDGTPPHELYDMMLACFEKPLLCEVMQLAKNNQSRAAEWLGLTRATLRKKLLQHGLVED
jgi:Fis family transcriptional regulator, factor for inversion stimulation protein